MSKESKQPGESFKRLGRKAPSLGKNTNSSTGSRGSKVAEPGGPEVTTENQANVEEQGTGRRRVRQEQGASSPNRR